MDENQDSTEQVHTQFVDTKSDKRNIKIVINSIYLIISIIIFLEIYAYYVGTIIPIAWDMFINEGFGPIFGIRVYKENLSTVINLILLDILAMIRAWLILKVDPPDPFPAGYKNLNMVVGLVLIPIFFIFIPLLILGLGPTIIITLFLVIYGYFALYRDVKKAAEGKTLSAAISQSRKIEPSSEKLTFRINKSGTIATVYQILNNNELFISAKRSTFNRIALYLLFILPFIINLFLIPFFTDLFDLLPWDQMNAELPKALLELIKVFQLFVTFIMLPLTFILLINKFSVLRRFHIYGADGTSLGHLKGSLFFSQWVLNDFFGFEKTKLRFSPFRRMGEIKNTLGVLKVETRSDDSIHLHCITVKDQNQEIVFEVISLDSPYVRKRFDIITTNVEERSLLVCLSSVCIIERWFRAEQYVRFGQS